MNKGPRWVNETPGIKKASEKRNLTDEEKQEAKKFEKAVKSRKIKEWFEDSK